MLPKTVKLSGINALAFMYSQFVETSIPQKKLVGARALCSFSSYLLIVTLSCEKLTNRIKNMGEDLWESKNAFLINRRFLPML